MSDEDVFGITDELDDEEEFLPNVPTITVRTSQGGTRYIALEEGEELTAGEVLQRANLYIQGSVEYWLNGVPVPANTIIPTGEEVTVVGNIKGG